MFRRGVYVVCLLDTRRRRNKPCIVRCKSEIYSLLALLFLLFPKIARCATTILGTLRYMDLADTQHIHLALK